MGYILLSFPFHLQAQSEDSIKITILLRIKAGSKSPQIFKAPLKYDKNFAFSFILDDGLVSAYKVAFPLFQGGIISKPYRDEWGSDQGGKGGYFKGLFYTDGCGNKQAFRGSLAINAHKIESDTVSNRGFLSWNEVQSMYLSGWGIMNHGFDHKTQKGNHFKEEIRLNQEAIKKHLGTDIHHFIVPGGEGETHYESQYIQLAFEQGFEAVGGNKGEWILNILPPFKDHHLLYKRIFLTDNTQKEWNQVKYVGQYLKGKKSAWIHVFTHSVGNQNLWNISCKYMHFRKYMISLERNYGIKGKDNIWMAPTEEVLDYLRIRDAYTMQIKRKDSTLSLALKIPYKLLNQRFRSISLKINQVKGYKIIGYKGCKNITFNPSTKGLINLDF